MSGLRKPSFERVEQLLTFRHQAVDAEASLPALTFEKASGGQAPERRPDGEVVIALQAAFNGDERQLASGSGAGGGGAGEQRMFGGTVPDNVRWAGARIAQSIKNVASTS